VKQTRAAIALQPASPSGESAIAASRRAQPRASDICSELETPPTKSSGAFFIFCTLTLSAALRIYILGGIKVA